MTIQLHDKLNIKPLPQYARLDQLFSAFKIKSVEFNGSDGVTVDGKGWTLVPDNPEIEPRIVPNAWVVENHPVAGAYFVLPSKGEGRHVISGECGRCATAEEFEALTLRMVR